jgi:Peptidase family M28
VLAEAAAVLALAAPGADAYGFAVSVARGGPRPAGSAAERRAHERMARRFRAAGLQVRVQPFPTPRGRSRNVIGIRSHGGPPRCVRVVMAHADSTPAGPGALDNASGLGVLAALAPRLQAIGPPCDVWLVATGAEERLHTGSPDHLGALALTRIVPRRRVRVALSLDEVGRGRRFLLRSPAPSARPRVERELLAAARALGIRMGWRRDDGTGNSDHREFELAGMPALKLGVVGNRCRHLACDRAGRLHRSAFARAQRVVEATLLRGAGSTRAAPARRPPGR